MIKFRKVEKGHYEIISNGQPVGSVWKYTSDQGHEVWESKSYKQFTGKDVKAESLTRKEAASALLHKMDSAPEITEPSCELCGDTGRVSDDILCWKCNQEEADDVSKEVEVNSVQKALYEIREGADIKIKDPHLVDMVIQELSEMGIPFIKWAIDKDYTGIMQAEEVDQFD